MKIPPRIADSLLEMPESGMGYQVVEASFQFADEKGIVFNAEEYIAGDRFLVEEGAIVLKAESEAQLRGPLLSMRVIERAEMRKSASHDLFEEILKGAAGFGGAEGAPTELCGNEIFGRFSPYRNDRRIRLDGSIMPGAFATPWKDAVETANAHSFNLINERYALPGPDLRKYLFKIQVVDPVNIKRGIAQPKYQRKGGGPEVILTDGTNYRAVYKYWYSENADGWDERDFT